MTSDETPCRAPIGGHRTHDRPNSPMYDSKYLLILPAHPIPEIIDTRSITTIIQDQPRSFRINYTFVETMHRRTPSQNLHASAVSSPIPESPRSPAYTSASKFRTYQQQPATPGFIPSIVTTSDQTGLGLGIHKEETNDDETINRNTAAQSVLEEELVRYSVRSSDALQELRVDILESNSGKKCYEKKRQLYSDMIVTDITDVQNGTISYAINRPLDSHQLFITSPLFPPRSAIPLQAEGLPDDTDIGLRFSVSISCRVKIDNIPDQLAAIPISSKIIKFQTFPSQTPSLYSSPPDSARRLSNSDPDCEEVIPLSPTFERLESGRFSNHILHPSRSSNRLSSSASSNSTGRHPSGKRQSWMSWSRSIIPSISTLGPLSSLPYLSTSAGKRRAGNDEEKGIWGECSLSSGKSFVILCPPDILPPPPSFPPSPDSTSLSNSSEPPSAAPPPPPRQRPILLFKDMTPLYSTTTQGEMIVDESVVRCLGVERGFWISLALGVLEAEEERVGWLAES